MFELLIWLTALVILGAMLISYVQIRDPIHPLVYLGPMLLYFYVFVPLSALYSGQLNIWFPDLSRLVFAQAVFAAGVTSFCLGCLSVRKTRTPACPVITEGFSPDFHRKTWNLAVFFGTAGVIVYLYSILYRGGFGGAYGHAKGGGGGLVSGWIYSIQYLGVNGISLLFVVRAGKRFRMQDFLLVAFFLTPFLVHGFLGARRGPVFVGSWTLFTSWVLIRRRVIPQYLTTIAICGIGFLMFFVVANRAQMYLGSESEVSVERAWTRATLTGERTIGAGNEYVFGAGAVLNARYHGLHFWGKRYAVILFIRPIPRQLWPTKYTDVFPEIQTNEGLHGPDWLKSVGWLPTRGAAPTFVSCFFVEFSWASVILCFLVGRLYGVLWKRARERGAIWAVLYISASCTSVFLASQSFGAWAHRLLLMTVPVAVLWYGVVFPRRLKKLNRRMSHSALRPRFDANSRMASQVTDSSRPTESR